MDTVDMKRLRCKLFDIPAGQNVKRSLFGQVDHEQTKLDLQRELKDDIQTKSRRWNFDFDNCLPLPRGKENGLEWVACPSRKTEYKIQPGISLVTSFTDSQTQSSQDRSSTLESKLNTTHDSLELRLQPSVENDEEKVIRIVNGSPPRPKFLKEEIAASKNKQKIVLTTSVVNSGKRKRLSQPTIDDYMKKKKPRVSMDFTSTKLLRRDSCPISTRLRNTPSKIMA